MFQLAAVVLLGAAPSCGAKTPEDALRRIEEAYRTKDVELAVACKDFEREARLMVDQVRPGTSSDTELVRTAAQTLEQAYRAEVKKTGLPDMKGVRCTVVKKEQGPGDLVRLTERCVWPGNKESSDVVTVAPSKAGWRLVITPD
jgi:hypothetical protein